MDTEADPDRLIGAVLSSRYRIEARLGGGAMGMVYLARHVKMGRTFAVKTLHSHLVSDEQTRRRFDREAELAGALHHPNVVSVVDVGEADGLRYLVMEYAHGKTLFELMAETGPLPAPRVISIVRQLLAGLEHAHDRGLIHRDFKPENIIVERDDGTDRPKIVDFGVAILRDDAASSGGARLTGAGVIIGTPLYMAPEHASGAPIDQRIDLFALGVICFEMLTGRTPFDGDGVDVVRANLLIDTPAMADRAPRVCVDPLLEAFTRKLMMKSRDARPPNAAAARALLELIDSDRLAAAAVLGVMRGDAPPTEAPPFRPLPVMPEQAHHPLPAGRHGLSPQAALPASGRNERTRAERLVSRAFATVTGLAVITAMVIGIRSSQRSPDATPSSQPAHAGQPSPDPLANAAEPETTTATLPPANELRIATPAATRATAHATADMPVTLTTLTREPRTTTAAALPARSANTAVRSASPVPAAADDSGAPSFILARSAASDTPPPPTATRVAMLYALVGKHLKSLDQARGSAATADLWPLFLRIRINDVIADPVKREEADALLRQLHDQIAFRTR